MITVVVTEEAAVTMALYNRIYYSCGGGDYGGCGGYGRYIFSGDYGDYDDVGQVMGMVLKELTVIMEEV